MVHVGSSQGEGGGNFEVRTPQVASVPHDIRTSSPTWIASAHANGFNWQGFPCHCALNQSLRPKQDHSITEFDARARNLQLFLLDKYPWIGWPDYLHLAAAHTKEILQTQDSIARYSAQGKEQKNKFVRNFKQRFARQHDNAVSVQDVYVRDWTLSSPLLRDLGYPAPTRKVFCRL